MSGLVGYGNTPVKITSGFNSSNLKEWYFDDQGNIVLPQNGNILDYNGNSVLGIDANAGNLVFNSNAIGNGIQGNPIQIETVGDFSTTFTWSFESNGNLTQPAEGALVHNRSIVKSNTSSAILATPTVLWTSTNPDVSSAKLVIQVECEETGDPTGWHCQTCEAVIASRGYANSIYGYGIPSTSIYGIIYTGTGALMTFTVQRNLSTLCVELIGTTTALANSNAEISIHSIEMITAG